MKKFKFLLIALLILSVALVACSDTDEEPETVE